MDLPHLQYTETEPNIIARFVDKSRKYSKYFKSIAFPEKLFHKNCSIWTIFKGGHITGKALAQKCENVAEISKRFISTCIIIVVWYASKVSFEYQKSKI